MTGFYIGGIVLSVLIVIYWLSRPQPQAVKGDELAVWPFESMPIMTDSERLFYDKLTHALPDYPIFVQVQLSRIIEPEMTDGRERQFWFNRICRQSVDYIVVDTDLQTVLLAIELDDWTHNTQTRKKQDAKKDKALASAGIAMMRFSAQKIPDSVVLRHEILTTIEQYT